MGQVNSQSQTANNRHSSTDRHRKEKQNKNNTKIIH